MFWGRIKIAEIFGFKIYIDASWLIIALLVIWSLATGYFPREVEGLPRLSYWAMGLFGLLGLFLSVVLHELSHSLAARRFGLPMRGITLFIFGGVAEMDDEPPSAKAEFVMAVAGPLCSVALGLLFMTVGRSLSEPQMATAEVLRYLGFINLALAAFNLVPAFPLDGGRVLRAALWAWRKDIWLATRWSTTSGLSFGALLIALGVLSVLAGQPGGLWWVLLGLFVRGAARMSREQLLVRMALRGEPIVRFVQHDGVAIDPRASIESLVDDFFFRRHHRAVPVMGQDGRLIGCVTVEDVKTVPRGEWAFRPVGAIAGPCTPANVIPATADAYEAFRRMQQNGLGRVIVADGDRLFGTVALRDLLEFLALRQELDFSGRARPPRADA